MTNPIIRIHDLSNNEIIDREMTDEEYQDFMNPKTSEIIAGDE